MAIQYTVGGGVEFDGQLVRKKLLKKFKTITVAAKKLGVSRQNLILHYTDVKGKRRSNLILQEKIASVLKCSLRSLTLKKKRKG